MSFEVPGLAEDLYVIQKLDDQPNDVGGLTAEELKLKFDEGPNRIKNYINNTLIPAVSDTVAVEEAREAAEEERAANEAGRVSAEASRVSAEAARASAETSRASAETSRASAESSRVSAESQRQAAEQARANETSGIVAQATAQAQNAQYSALSADGSAGAAFTSASTASTCASAAFDNAGAAAGSAARAGSSASEAASSASAAASCASEAASFAQSAEGFKNTAKSWTVGGTGTRSGEDTDNAKYYCEQAKVSGVGRDLSGKTVKPTPGSEVTAGTGAEIFNDYREREFAGSLPFQGNVASGNYSGAEGETTTASGLASHAEGSKTMASGLYSHAEGRLSVASGGYSHAEGDSTTASGGFSHAEGRETTASGFRTHAEGFSTEAAGEGSHAEGEGTIAAGGCQHVSGKYNVSDTTSAVIVGNGSSSGARSNAMTLDWSGNLVVSGTVTDGSGTTLKNSIPVSEKGTANGVATLDNDGKVPSAQLPGYVDDVLEYSALSAFPATGEAGKIYVALDTNRTYRWSGSAYVEISASLALGETSSTAYRGDRGKIAYDHSQLTGSNPHGTTAAQVGAVPTTRTVNGKALSANISLTASDVGAGTETAVQTAQSTADNAATAAAAAQATANAAIPAAQKGVANGVATLGSDGKVPSAQLPGYVDNVLEYSSLSDFPETGESGKIYVALDTNKTYRWSGSVYAEISASLALGETSSTAYRGDRGKIAYDHSQLTGSNPHGTTAAQVGAVPTTRTVNGKALSANISLTASDVGAGTETAVQAAQTTADNAATAAAAAQTTANGKWTAVDGTTGQKGIVQLNSATNSSSTTEAATPSAVKAAKDAADAAQTTANGKWTAVDGTTGQKGIVQLSDSTSSTSTTLAATANAVKAAKDAADAAQTTANGKWTAVDGTTGQKGIVQLNSATNSSSTTQAATPSAVKSAYDLANSAVPKTRTVNGKALSADISLTASDVGAAAPANQVQLTLSVAGWTGSGPYSQTVSVSGLTASGTGYSGLAQSATAEQRAAARKALLSVTAQAAGSITFTADGRAPAVALPVVVTF